MSEPRLRRWSSASLFSKADFGGPGALLRGPSAVRWRSLARCCTIPALVGIVILSACSATGTDPTSFDEASTTVAATLQPRANATYHGDLVAETGVTGWVTFKTSGTGDIMDPFVWLEMTDFDCGDGTSLTSGHGASPLGVVITVTDGRFEYTGSQTWLGVFTSDSMANGTVEGSLIQPNCEFGPIGWTAELSAIADSTTTTGQVASTTVATSADIGEYADLCAIQRRIVERAELESTSTEGAAFWVPQSDDTALMVDLVPGTLRADMALSAEAWRQLTELLSGYSYDFQILIDTVGVDAYTEIFTPEVTAADRRVQEFIAATCGS